MDASKKAYIIAVTIQLIYTGMFVISKAAFDHGINTYVFMFYRQAAGSLLLLPLTLLRHRSYPHSVSSWMLLKLFICALIGITFTLNLYQVSLKFTSATVASATDNSVPVVTFFIALLLRMEHVKLKSWSGVAKITGVALCLAGVLVIAFYAGPLLSPVNHHRAFASHASRPSGANNVTRGGWVKWTLLMVLANMTYSLWIVLQAPVLKECPDKIFVTAAQCFFSMVQSLVIAMVAERDFSRWKLSFDISLLAVFYAGFVVMGVGYYLQAWCVELKGPVFLASWTPFCFICTIFSSSFFLGEIVHLGSIVGGILLVGGLYSVLWGKSKESKIEPCREVTKVDDPQDEQKQNHLEIKEERGLERGRSDESTTLDEEV